MTGFFQELSKKLAERWVALLVVPGILVVVSAVVGWHLGHRHALNWSMAARYVSDQVAAVAKLPGGTQAAVVVGLLIAASVTGLVVQAMAGVTRRLFLGTWPWPLAPLARRRVHRRRRRWDELWTEQTTLEAAQPPAQRTLAEQEKIDTIAARKNAIALAPPSRPTWIGDRMHGVGTVAWERYRLDLTFGWSRLWLVLPEATRAEITAAHAAFAAAVAVAGWSWPLLALGALWWPTAVIGLVVGATGWVRARDAVADLAALTESALDLHGRALAIALGAEDANATGPLTHAEGLKITATVRKGR